MVNKAELMPLGTDDARELESRSVEDIRNDIATRRAVIAETFDRLGDKVGESLDWRTYIHDRPLVALGVAAGTGFLISRIFKPRPSPKQRIVNALVESLEDVRGQMRTVTRGVMHEPSGGGVGGAIKAAAVAAITKAAAEYVQTRLNPTDDLQSGHPDDSTQRHFADESRSFTPKLYER